MDDTKQARESVEKKEYSAPKILQTEQITARAAICNRIDSTCAPGPLMS